MSLAAALPLSPDAAAMTLLTTVSMAEMDALIIVATSAAASVAASTAASKSVVASSLGGLSVPT